MGASGWKYFVPYQADIEAALHKLREQVFRSGDFLLRPQMNINPDDYVNALEEVRERVPEWIKHEESFTQPTTIEALIEWNAEEGTHSILDINRISPTPDFNAAAPLSTEQLIEICGSDKPERSMVDQKSSEIQYLLRSWQASYIIVYKDGAPHEIFFTGFSGD